jgi:hypothetical protein
MDAFEGDPDSPPSLHKYAYAQNEPVLRLDPTGNQSDDIASFDILVSSDVLISSEPTVHVGSILAKAHAATGGTGIFLQGHHLIGFSHSFLRITPTDQALWLRTRSNDFKNMDQNRNYFATIGAGPFGGKLFKGINRDTDVTEPYWLDEKLNVSQQDENDTISKLFQLYSNYRNNLNYSPIPSLSVNSGYNSNSFTMGLLNAAGLDNPASWLYEDQFPGWEKPVPPRFFGV